MSEKKQDERALEAFEFKFGMEYAKNHAVSAVKAARETAESVSDIVDSAQVEQFYESELAANAQKRRISLAVRAYHNALAHALKATGITLPAFEELFPDEPRH